MNEMTSMRSRSQDPEPGCYVSHSAVSRSRKASMSKSPTEIGSFVTADDGTPSPGDALVSQESGRAFFGSNTSASAAVAAVTGGSGFVGFHGASPAVSGSGARGHRRTSSGTSAGASGGATGIGNGGMASGGNVFEHSDSSQQDVTREGVYRKERTRGMERSRSSRKNSRGRRRKKGRSRSRSRSQSRSPHASAKLSNLDGSGFGGGIESGGAGAAMGLGNSGGGPTLLTNRPPSFRTGFSGLFSSSDGSPSLKLLDNSNRNRIEREVGEKPRGSDETCLSAKREGEGFVDRPKKHSRACLEEESPTPAERRGFSKLLSTQDSAEKIRRSKSPGSRRDNSASSTSGGDEISLSWERGKVMMASPGHVLKQRSPNTSAPNQFGDHHGEEETEEHKNEEMKKAEGPSDSNVDAGAVPAQATVRPEGQQVPHPNPEAQDSLKSDQGVHEMAHSVQQANDAPAPAQKADDVHGDSVNSTNQHHVVFAGQSTSEVEDVVSDLPAPGSTGGSRQRHSSGRANPASARPRTGSQDSADSSDVDTKGCPSPATVNAILNSRIGAMSRYDLPNGVSHRTRGFVSAYNKGYASAYKSAYERYAAGCVVDEGAPYRGRGFGQSLKGIYSNLGHSSLNESEDEAESSDSAHVPVIFSNGAAEPPGPHAVVLQAMDEAEEDIAAQEAAAAEEAAAAQEMAARQAAARRAAAEQAANQIAAARESVARKAMSVSPRHKWSAGQSSVFETSGSSSSEDEGKPRGLRGVQVLDPITPGGNFYRPKTTRSRSIGGEEFVTSRGRFHTGIAGPMIGHPSTGVGNLAGIVSHAGSHAQPRDSRSVGSRMPRLELLKGMPGLSQDSPLNELAYSYGRPQG